MLMLNDLCKLHSKNKSRDISFSHILPCPQCILFTPRFTFLQLVCVTRNNISQILNSHISFTFLKQNRIEAGLQTGISGIKIEL